MKYSIIVPTYNVEKYIIECLESINRILPQSSEVILVDDGSSDKTSEIVRNWIEGKKQYSFFQNHHGGVSKARNTALDMAKGEFICFVDSDDILEKEFFKLLERELDESIDIFHFNYINFNEKTWKNKEQLNFIGSGKDFLNQALLQDKYSTAICMHVFKKSFFDRNKIRFVEDIFHEDEEFNIHCMLLAKKVKSCNDYVYLYRIHPKSITQNIEYAAERTKSKFFIYEKYKQQMENSNEKVYITLCTYLSIMLLLEISKYPSNSMEFKELSSRYKEIRAIDMVKTDLVLYKCLKALYKVKPSFVYIALRMIKKIKK